MGFLLGRDERIGLEIKSNRAPLGASTPLFIFFAFVGWVFGFANISTFLLMLSFLQILNRFIRLKIIQWTHAMVFESFAIAFSILIRVLSRLFRKKGDVGVGNRPILLVHGYLHDQTAWVFLKRRLKNRGLGPIYTINLGNPFLSIPQYGKKIADLADQIRIETGSSSLTLIGHSMGGLVSSWYATHLAPPGRVKEVITIGTPFDGTLMAHMGIGANTREMEKGSEFIKGLQADIQSAEEIQFFQIGSRTDQMIIPSHSAFYGAHPERQYLIDDLGHMALLYSPRVAEQLIQWLR